MTLSTIATPSVTTVKPPVLCEVIFINDEITKFQLVIDILVNYFNKSEDDAYDLAMQAHVLGSATGSPLQVRLSYHLQ